MQHDVEKHILDILSAAKDIQQFVGAMSFDEYHANRLVKAASRQLRPRRSGNMKKSLPSAIW